MEAVRAGPARRHVGAPRDSAEIRAIFEHIRAFGERTDLGSLDRMSAGFGFAAPILLVALAMFAEARSRARVPGLALE